MKAELEEIDEEFEDEDDMKEFLGLKEHTQECIHCSKLADVLFIKIKEHKKLMESNQ